jgi:hypothetical protein
MKPLENLTRESAVEIRADLLGLLNNKGFQRLYAEFSERAKDMRGDMTPIMSADFGDLMRHNQGIFKAEATEDVLRWTQDAVEQCTKVIE